MPPRKKKGQSVGKKSSARKSSDPAAKGIEEVRVSKRFVARALIYTVLSTYSIIDRKGLCNRLSYHAWI